MRRRILAPILLAVAVAAGPTAASAQVPASGAERRTRPGADGRGHADRRWQPRQPALLGADADHQAEPRPARTGLADARLGGRAGQRRRRPADDADRGRRRHLPRHARRRGHRRRRRDRRAQVEVGAGGLRARTAPGAASPSATARSTRSPTATASSPSTRTPATRSGSCSRPIQAGVDLGNIDKVATVYHDGVVYVHTNDGDRGAVVRAARERRQLPVALLRGTGSRHHLHRRQRQLGRRRRHLGPGAARRHRLRSRRRCDAVDARRGRPRARLLLHDLRQRAQLHAARRTAPCVRATTCSPTPWSRST